MTRPLVARQDGFTIIEVVVAMVLLAVVLTSLAQLTFFTARQTVRTADMAARDAASLDAVNYFGAVAFTNLANRCDTTGTTNALYSRCATVTGAGQTRSVTVVTTPLHQRNVPPTTVTFTRAGPPPTNPLCTTGC